MATAVEFSLGSKGVPDEEGEGDAQANHSGPHYLEELSPIFGLRVKRTGSLTYVELLGEFDLSCEDQFRAVTDEVQSGRLVLDLRSLTFIDSMGLRTMLRTWQRSQQDGFSLEIVRGHGQVEKVFRITGVDRMLPMVD